MTQEEIYRMLVDLAALEELSGPPTGPWGADIEDELGGGLRKEVAYSDGFLTFRSIIDHERVETTERYVPQSQREAIDRWLEIKAYHMGELIQLIHGLKGAIGDLTGPPTGRLSN